MNDRALRHIVIGLGETANPNPGAVERGLVNLAAHLDSAAHFGKPVIVAINQFATDTPAELGLVHAYCESRNVPCATANVFGEGGRGATELAEKVVAAAEGPETPLKMLYPLSRPSGFTVHVRDIEIAAGAGFLVALTGEIMRMPGLPERPAAECIDVDADGTITGLS